MTSLTHSDVTVLAQEATRIGARPFKAATGSWSTAVEVALMDAVLSCGAQHEGVFGAGVLPRLRAYKAYRGQANMMRLLATLGPFALDDFVADPVQITVLMNAAAALMDAGVQGATDVDAASQQQRAALISVDGVPELAWEYFLVILGNDDPKIAQQRTTWLTAFVDRTTGRAVADAERTALLTEVADTLNAEHQKKSFGRMPEFTLAQLEHAVYRTEYARATA